MFVKYDDHELLVINENDIIGKYVYIRSKNFFETHSAMFGVNEVMEEMCDKKLKIEKVEKSESYSYDKNWIKYGYQIYFSDEGLNPRQKGIIHGFSWSNEMISFSKDYRRLINI